MKIYSRFITTLLIILVIVLLGVGGYYIYLLYDNYKNNKIADDLIAQFTEETSNQEIVEDNDTEEPEKQEKENNSPEEPQQQTETPKSSNRINTYNVGANYGGYKVIGIISIPSLEIQYPIFGVDNSRTLSIGTAAIYPQNVEQALNKQGNVVIAGHNYRNNAMFSKLHTLKEGDSIIITDMSGKKLEYMVYNNYTADVNDFNYATRLVEDGVAEISLSTCTNNVNTRTVIWAKAEL